MGDEPLPGYRLIAPLGRGGFGEVWKCLAPGGLQKAIKFVAEDAAARAAGRTPLRTEYEAFQRVKGIRHPFLLQLERVELVEGELLMVMELADSSLLQRFDACRRGGLIGVPRGELLSYMVDAAEALDVLSRQHKLQHLDVKPANLFLLGGHVKVGDYGLVAHFERGDATGAGLGRGLTPKYVAPEVLVNRVDPRSDQYTLALVYLELLTGSYPYDGDTAQRVLHQHAHAEPDLTDAPDADRAALRRALAKRPADRFPSCLELVKALLGYSGRGPAEAPPGVPPPPRAATLTTPSGRAGSPFRATTPTPLDCTVAVTSSPHSQTSATLRVAPAGLNLYGPATARAMAVTPSGRAAEELQRAFPGYRLVTELEAGPRGTLVRATDPAGRPTRVQTVDLGHGSAGEVEAVLRGLAALPPRPHHKLAVPDARRVAFAWPDDCPTLADRHRESSAAGTPTPRPQLLDVLGAVAKALDEAHRLAGFAHGLLSPAAIVARPGHEGVTGFGVGELLRRTRPELDWVARDPFAAPEALKGEAAPASDQYSLALIFLAVVNAWTPGPRRPGSSADQAVNLGALRDYELAAARKALSTRPADRHATCAAFVAALAPPATGRRVLDELRAVESSRRLAGDPAPAAAPPALGDLVGAILRLAPAPALGATPTRQPDHRWACRLPALLTPDLLRLKLDQFRADNGLTALPVGPGAHAYRTPAGLGKPGAELTVAVPPGSTWHAAELTVHARSVGGLDSLAKDLPAAVTQLLEKFRRAVQPHPDRRASPRRRADLAVTLVPIDDELRLGDPLTAQCRDLSAGGFGCATDGPAPTGHLFATFPGSPATAPWGILCQVVRHAPDPTTGQTVLGVRFLG